MLQVGIKDKTFPQFDPAVPTPRAINYGFNDNLDAKVVEATFERLGETGKTIADIKHMKCLMEEGKPRVAYVPADNIFSVTEAEAPESVRGKDNLTHVRHGGFVFVWVIVIVCSSAS